MKVLITRAEPAATQTADKLQQHGHEAILLPLFEIKDLNEPIPNEAYDGIIFTSKNSVETLQARNWILKNKSLPAFCVGEKTEIAAQMLGFTKTYTAKGGGLALAKLMGDLNLSGSQFLYPSTPDKSFDIESALRPHGINVDTVDIYQVNPIMPDKHQMKEAVTRASSAYVFVYSSLSGQHFARILETINLTSVLKACTLVGISKQAVNSLEHIEWKEVLIAEEPDESHMIALLK